MFFFSSRHYLTPPSDRRGRTHQQVMWLALFFSPAIVNNHTNNILSSKWTWTTNRPTTTTHYSLREWFLDKTLDVDVMVQVQDPWRKHLDNITDYAEVDQQVVRVIHDPEIYGFKLLKYLEVAASCCTKFIHILSLKGCYNMKIWVIKCKTIILGHCYDVFPYFS